MIWDQLTSEELDGVNRNVPVILPIAATEQHGPHLPLATDRLIGEYIVNGLHKSIPNKVLILPAMSVGCSEHHMAFTGTLTQRHKSFILYVFDVVESVINHGFSRILLLNSHGGNQAAGQVLIEQVGAQYPDTHLVLATWWQLATEKLKEISESGKGGVGHAGEFETSLMMLIAPHLLRADEIDSGTNTENFKWADGDMLRSPQASYYRTMEEIAPNGVFGDPSSASKEKGQKIIDCILPALERIAFDLWKI